jgi:broad specificity phosphatase PhoE
MIKMIHVFRHGQTDWNREGKLQGHSNISLNIEGRRQAETLQKYFNENPVELFFTSDLLRAQETTGLANKQLNKPVHVHPSLREAYLGDLEGLTIEEVKNRFGNQSWETWNSVSPETFNFAYPNAETSNEIILRLTKAIQHLCHQTSFAAAGLCTHGFAMKKFLHSLNPCLKNALPIPNCVVYRLSWESSTNKFDILI